MSKPAYEDWQNVPEILNEVMTASEVSQVYGVDTGYIRERLLTGKLRGRKSGSTWLITREDAEARFGNREKR